jgi:hypothetical protein
MIDHTPPGVVFVKAEVTAPSHTTVDPPLIGLTVGTAFTVNGNKAEFEQPSTVTVYTRVIVPGVVPVTMPSAETVALPVPEITDHTPLGVAFVNAGVPEPTQTVEDPPAMELTTGRGLIVKVAMEEYAAGQAPF